MKPAVSKRFTLLWLTALCALTIYGCEAGSGAPNPPTAGTATVDPTGSQEPLEVAASFYPIEFFAGRAGKDLVEIFNPVPPGVEPHDLELSPRSIERIQQARVFLYLGHGFQPAVDRAVDTMSGSTLIAKDVSDGIEMVSGAPHEDAGTGTPPAEEHEDQAEPSDAVDPHIWLDPVRAQVMVNNIEDALVLADPANEPAYRINAEKLRSELAALDGEYLDGLANCKRSDIITSHTAFAYLAERYGLEQVSITGVSPEAEPSPRRLQEIIEFARAHDVKYIFFETLVEPRVSRVIADEVGAQTLVLNPIEGLTEEQVKAGKDYFSLMRENLANLKLALECSS